MFDKTNIIDTIGRSSKFSTFAAMLQTSKVADLITGRGPFTVFAPTNDAFGKVPDAERNGWNSEPGQTELARVLSYHIVPSKLFATNLGRREPAATLTGDELIFSDVTSLKVNDSIVGSRNIEATNGIIHALDTVLTPPAAAQMTQAAAANADAATTPIAAPLTSPMSQADGFTDVAEDTAAEAKDELPIPAPAAALLPAIF